MEPTARTTPVISPAISTTYIGIDIGGTNSKVAVLSPTKIDLQGGSHLEVELSQGKKHLFVYSHQTFSQFWDCLQEINELTKGKVKVAGTGGGAFSKAPEISTLFDSQLVLLNEFDANAAGLGFYQAVDLPVQIERHSLSQEGKIHSSSKVSTLKEVADEASKFIFVSLGSGVNWQIFGQGQGGQAIERKRLEEGPKGEFIMEGTNLGAGFLMGLGRLLTGETNYGAILSRMRGEDEFVEFYEAVLVNLFQMSINMTFIHKQHTLLVSGSLLSYTSDITGLFSKAMNGFSNNKQPFQRTVLWLLKLEGFLGTLGALQHTIGSECCR